jgi:hypothetical protein
MTVQQDILTSLRAFQEGYTRRDVNQLDAFMELFTPDVEIIGTNGIKPGAGEWYTSRDAARELVKGDWEGWGDLHLEMESANIQTHGDVGWIAVPATVTEIIGAENYASFLAFIKVFIEESPLPPEEKLLSILRGGTNTVYELRRGTKFVWPLRLTAVVVRQAAGWQFAQVHFSFPTTHFPDERIFE